MTAGGGTGRLGFGCAAIGGTVGARDGRMLIERALAAGITHFDTAPPYGIGRSERILGEALRGVGAAITVATKAGIEPPAHGGAKAILRGIALPLRRLAPSLWKRGAGATVKSTLGAFGREAVRRSVERSLEALRRSHIDVLWLHEPDERDLTDELRRVLADLRAEGLVRAVGIGSERHARAVPLLGGLRQGEWNLFADGPWPPDEPGEAWLHGVVRQGAATLRARCAAWPELAEAAARLGVDPANGAGAAELAVAGILAGRGVAGVIVSTTRAERLDALAHAAASDAAANRGLALAGLLRGGDA